jgi:TonB family protein
MVGPERKVTVGPRAGAALIALVVSMLGAASARAQDWAPPLTGPGGPKRAPVLTKPPQILKSVEPVYPADALKARLSADVTLQVDIDAEGHVTKVEVPKPAGNGFDEAAKDAVMQYQFSPAEIDGKPGAIRISLTLHFVPKLVEVMPDGGAPTDAAPLDAAPPPPPPPPPPPKIVVGRGRLREKGTRNPLVDAEVSVIARPAGGPEAAAVLASVTDADGRFVVEGEPGVALRVIVADPSHEPCIRDLAADKVSAAVPFDVECLVPKRLGARYETTVRAPPPTQAVTRYTLTQPELTSVPGTFGDPLRVVENLPGVARPPFGLGLLVIRGAAPADSGIFVEGHSIPILYHFLGGPSILTPRLIKDVEFYPGNFGVKYGNVTAGIIDVGVTTDATPRLHGQVEIRFLDSSAYVEGPLAKGWTGSVSARRSYIDAILPFVLPSSTTTAAPVYWDYQLGVHRDLAGGRVALFAFGSDDTLKVISKDPSTGTLDIGTETEFHKVIGVWTSAWGPWVNRLSPAWGWAKIDFGVGQVGFNSTRQDLELRDEVSRPLGAHVVYRLGLDVDKYFQHLFLNFPNAVVETRLYGDPASPPMPINVPEDSLDAALYTDATWQPGHGLTITPGVRGDFFRSVEQNRLTLDPRVVVRWAVTNKQTFKGGAGIFHQMQEAQLLDPRYGTPSLPAIRAEQYSLGFVRQLTDKITLDTTFYYVARHNQPVPAPGGGFTASGRERAYGMELILKHEFTERFFGWIAYTLARAEQTAYSVNGAAFSNQGMGSLQTGAQGTTWYPTDFDQTHNLIAVGSYAWRAWRFGTRFRVVSGTPETPVSEGAYDADMGVYACRQGPTNSARKPTFNELDLRGERLWTFNAWQLGAYLEVWNVYNATNPELIIPDYRCRGSEAIRGIPFLPILGVRGMF